MFKKICVGAAALFILSGCGLQNTADDMVKTSGEIKDDSKHLSKRTDDLEAELSKGNTYVTFDKKISDLFFDQNDSVEADLTHDGGATIEALPFQFWNGDYFEDMADLDVRFKVSADWLFSRVVGQTNGEFPVDVRIPSRSYKAIASLSVWFTRLSDRYAALLKAKGFPQITLYSVIVTALKDRHEQGSDLKEQFPLASDKIRTYRPEALYMLQLRHNYFPMMVLSRFTSFASKGNIGRFLMSVDWPADFLKNWFVPKVNLNQFDASDSELAQWTEWLNEALTTREDLRAMGVEPQYNGMFAKILRNVDFDQKTLAALPEKGLSTHQLNQVQFAKAFSKVVNDSNAFLKTIEFGESGTVSGIANAPHP